VRKLPHLLRKDIKVTLTCGCRVLLWDQPRTRNSKFACGSNLGHGYSLAWVSWSDVNSDIPIYNKQVPR
jgi:hypothetical protein